MQDWITKTENFLQFNEYPVLDGKGQISQEQAREKAEEIYSTLRIEQDKAFKSDFEKELAKWRKWGIYATNSRACARYWRLSN